LDATGVTNRYDLATPPDYIDQCSEGVAFAEDNYTLFDMVLSNGVI